jgi:hypothetical protein
MKWGVHIDGNPIDLETWADEFSSPSDPNVCLGSHRPSTIIVTIPSSSPPTRHPMRMLDIKSFNSSVRH